MRTQLMSNTQVKDLVKQFKDLDYDVEETKQAPYKSTYVIYSGDRVVFRGLPHSSGKNYLVQYDNNLIKAVA